MIILSWQDHIDYISSKISKSVNIITKLKRHVTNQSLIKYLLCTCKSLSNLWLSIVGNNCEVLLAQLVKLHNKAVRIINNVPLRDHITAHYVNLGLIKLSDIVKFNTF